MDFANTASDAIADDQASMQAAPAATPVMFRSRRATASTLREGSAATALRASNLTLLPIDALLKRTNGKAARITPRDPVSVETRPFSLFKTVTAMRGQQGYRLRP
ncbi:MAG: hypothetical protein WBN04_14865 [Paracoccaceae bacterium]